MEKPCVPIKEGKKTKEYRYFISSLKTDIETVSQAIRGHWSIESMHWHLDITFREDADTTLDKQAAQNHNIIRKWSLSILKKTEWEDKNIHAFVVYEIIEIMHGTLGWKSESAICCI